MKISDQDFIARYRKKAIITLALIAISRKDARIRRITNGM